MLLCHPEEAEESELVADLPRGLPSAGGGSSTLNNIPAPGNLDRRLTTIGLFDIIS